VQAGIDHILAFTMTPTKRKSTVKSGELIPADGIRTGLSVADLKQSFLDNLFCGMAGCRWLRRATTPTRRWR